MIDIEAGKRILSRYKGTPSKVVGLAVFGREVQLKECQIDTVVLVRRGWWRICRVPGVNRQ